MSEDVRHAALFQEAERLYTTVRRPGTGQTCDAAELNVAPDGRRAVFSASIFEKLEGSAPSHVCLIDLATGEMSRLTSGPHFDHSPKFSPAGDLVAFISNRNENHGLQLRLLELATGTVRSTAPVAGWVEYFHWSPDGKRILLGVAGHGADVSCAEGAVTSQRLNQAAASWMPIVETGDEEYRWRRAWVCEVQTGDVRPASPTGLNIWEATWCGHDAIAVIASTGHTEGLWYSARLYIVDIGSSRSREMYVPRDQLGCPAGSPAGRHVAVVEALCSDRLFVAGDLLLVDLASYVVRRIDIHGVDVSHVEWRSADRLLIAGHRGFQTVLGLYDVIADTFTEVWSSEELTTSGIYTTVSGFGDLGDCALIGENFLRAPEIAIIRGGEYHAIRSFDLGYAPYAQLIRSVERITWNAPDGLQIKGWLLRPKNGTAPHPLVMNIHGGPVWQWRPMWLGRRGAAILMLLKRGYAIFFPNPRGGAGEGQEFARHVLGEMGGADTSDYLSGIDFLVREGIADPARLGVTGLSYGGFMASWLITRDVRFAAAVSVAPITNQVTWHLVSNIPQFVSLFLKDTYTNPDGKYFQRSPINFAHKARTPTLSICGGLDRCTPPVEAVQFHNALLENGVKSVLVTYPQEGHGVRKYPAAMDYAARVVGWFEAYMGAGQALGQG